MKKISALIIALLTMILLVGCGEDDYEPVESTEEEAKIVMAFECDGETYGVRYELYRALFLGNKNLVDGGDESVWSGENRAAYIDKINEIIAARAYEIFSALHVAEKIGFDPYSKEANKKINEYIKGAVEGDESQIGHGSYEKYLASLKDNYLNYSVATLLMRYSMSMDAINAYYAGYEHEAFGNMQGDYKYTKEDVKSYYFSDNCARIIEAYIPKGVRDEAWITSFRDKLISSSEQEMAVQIISNTTATEADLLVDGKISGMVIGKSSLDTFFYSRYLEEVFSATPGTLGETFELSGTDADGHYMIYGLEKSEEHFERCYEQVRLSYIDNVIGEKIGTATEKFRESTTYAEDYASIIHSEISMD